MKAIPKPMNPDESQSLSLTIRILGEKPQVGDPVPIEFTIRNDGKTDYAYLDRSYDRGGRMDEYELTALSPTGKEVEDPRATNGSPISGGLASKAVLKPGQSFHKTIDLNRWALLREPGQYTVTGVYHLENSSAAAKSKAIQFRLAPRNKAEMSAHISLLLNELPTAKNEQYDTVLQKLMFTGDPIIIPALIDAMYKQGNNNFWITEALNCYLPLENVKPAILKACKARGLAPGSSSVIYKLKRPWTPGHDPLSKAEWNTMIVRSLASDNPVCWSEGSLVAQTHPDDAYTKRLIEIAESPQSKARGPAIYALAFNRTDNSVKALKSLLNDPEDWVREAAKSAIKLAYSDHSFPGRRLLDTDFDQSFRKPQ